MRRVEVARAQVEEIVHRETCAWDTKDVDLLLSVFHPDMVWPWPRSYTAHDPAEWRLVMGKFDANRWRRRFQELFDTHDLVHNRREIVYVEVSAERDAGLAVVEVDTLWRRRSDGEEQHWLGRACKVYSLVGDELKMTMHTGLLDYEARE
jgi:ketosteroid isomerase-like protein